MMRKQRPSYSNKTASPSQERLTRFHVDQPAELMNFLLEHVTNKARNAIKGMLARGQVSVNEQVTTRYNHPLEAGDTVSLFHGKIVEEVKPIGLQILHEDEEILVIHKEAGLLSIAGGEEKELTAHRQLMEYVRRTNPKNRVFVVHRLDRDTSGVMLFAKTEKAQQTLQNSWQDAVLERSYIALVERQVKKAEGTIVSWLKETRTLKMYSNPTPNGGQEAITHYKVLQSTRDFSLLEIHLETGRKNQIRVHMQDIGHPIVGDKKYGSRQNPIGRLGLHAKVLAFKHPATGQMMRFETPVPAKFMRVFGQPAANN